MRWSNLAPTTAPSSPAADTLPLAVPDAVVRTFDTPGFAGMTFYEIRAKSIINRVPGSSRVPFEWTINPYRGCTHACRYCLAGDTPILMADGRARALAGLRVGDRICGTVQDGRHRRYVATEVLAHWSTVKPAYRVTLADGAQLVASGDHRFLTTRGWKHVTGRTSGGGRRPGLTTGDELMGTGRFAAPPKHSDDYCRGYLCGVIRVSARLALTDPEARERAERYLAGFGVRIDAHTSALTDVPAVQRLVTWPAYVTDGWSKGFLAGIVDTTGDRATEHRATEHRATDSQGGAVRLATADPEIIHRVALALQRYGFKYTVESPGGEPAIRLAGGLRERLRLAHTVDPAATGKRIIDGASLTSDPGLRVVLVEPLGLELPLFDITTGTGDFVADGVVSHNCFARNTHTYLDLDAGDDFDRRVVVKVNAGELLRRELAAPRWRGDPIAMGTNVDCYQRAEGRYELMREILAGLRDFANPFSILTKGTLILRDLDLLRQAAEVTEVGLAVSVGLVDEALWRSVEPGTPSPRRRLDVVRRLTDAGFPVAVLMAPILPGLTDDDDSIESTVAAIAAAGAASVTPIVLHLRPGAREWYGRWLAGTHPDLVPRYRQWYARGAYAPKAYQQEVSARVRTSARHHGMPRQSAPSPSPPSPSPPSPSPPSPSPPSPSPPSPSVRQPTLW